MNKTSTLLYIYGFPIALLANDVDIISAADPNLFTPGIRIMDEAPGIGSLSKALE